MLSVAGLRTVQILSINNESMISKNMMNSYENTGADVINKIQPLEIGVLVSDARTIKLVDLTSKSVLITVPAPKEGGLIRDWHAVKDITNASYNLLVITSYGSIF